MGAYRDQQMFAQMDAEDSGYRDGLADGRAERAAEVATCHRLIARLEDVIDGAADVLQHHGFATTANTLRTALDPHAPDEARVLDTVRAGGDEEKAL